MWRLTAATLALTNAQIAHAELYSSPACLHVVGKNGGDPTAWVTVSKPVRVSLFGHAESESAAIHRDAITIKAFLDSEPLASVSGDRNYSSNEKNGPQVSAEKMLDPNIEYKLSVRAFADYERLPHSISARMTVDIGGGCEGALSFPD